MHLTPQGALRNPASRETITRAETVFKKQIDALNQKTAVELQNINVRHHEMNKRQAAPPPKQEQRQETTISQGRSRSQLSEQFNRRR